MALALDEGTVVIKLGSEKPVASMQVGDLSFFSFVLYDFGLIRGGKSLWQSPAIYRRSMSV